VLLLTGPALAAAADALGQGRLPTGRGTGRPPRVGVAWPAGSWALPDQPEVTQGLAELRAAVGDRRFTVTALAPDAGTLPLAAARAEMIGTALAGEAGRFDVRTAVAADPTGPDREAIVVLAARPPSPRRRRAAPAAPKAGHSPASAAPADATPDATPDAAPPASPGDDAG
jgi:hypothetical protein